MTQDGAWGHRRGLGTRRTAQHGEGEEQSGDRRQMCEELVAARCAGSREGRLWRKGRGTEQEALRSAEA